MYSNEEIGPAFARMHERLQINAENRENIDEELYHLCYSQKQTIIALQAMSECVDRMSAVMDKSIQASKESKQIMAVKIENLNKSIDRVVENKSASLFQLLIVKISVVFSFFREYLRHINARGIICGVVVCNAVYIVWKHIPQIHQE